MPASITGCSTPSISVKRVRIGITLITARVARSLSAMPKGRTIGFVALGAVVVAAIGLVAAWAIDEAHHDDKVARNTVLGGRPIGGLNRAELAAAVKTVTDRYAGAEVDVKA